MLLPGQTQGAGGREEADEEEDGKREEGGWIAGRSSQFTEGKEEGETMELTLAVAGNL